MSTELTAEQVAEQIELKTMAARGWAPQGFNRKLAAEMIAAAIRAAEAAAWVAGRDAAAGVCRERAANPDEDVTARHRWESRACADAIAALALPADVGGAA